MATTAIGGIAAPTPYASASLYVGDLEPDVTEALLFDIFNAVGPVASVRVCRDAATRRSLGYAYVNFHRVDDAERALDTMNFKIIRSKPCRIMWSHRDPSLRKSGVGNIFVNHLSKSIDNKQLYDTFSMFGTILSCKVCTNANRESLGYGFVHYESEESAQTAIARVDGKVIAGERVSVSMFKSKKERGVNQNKFTNVFVKNIPGEVTKEELDGLFSKFGAITSSILNIDKENPTRSFGFINFATPEEAAAAVEQGNGVEFKSNKLFVSRAQKKEEREKELRERFETAKLERQKKWAGVNLYVKNLSDEMDDARLTSEFSKFGNITSAKVMRDSTTKSRGFGFVCFSSPEEATKAVTEINGRMIDGKPLYVSLAQRKEARKQQLEQQYAARAKLGPQAGVGGMAMGQLNMLPGGMNPLTPQQQAQLSGMQLPYPQGALPLYGGAGIPGHGMPQNRLMYNGMNPMGLMQPGMVPRWNAQQGRGPVPGQPGQMGFPMIPPAQQQAMMANMQGGNAQGVRQGQPSNRGGRQAGASPQQQMRGAANQQMKQVPPHLLQQQQQGMRPGYPNGRVPGSQQPQPPMDNIAMPSASEPLTIKMLAAAPEEMRKQMIGERLFPLIKIREPVLAGKITGMLLEMDDSELIHLLESHQALHDKINEALHVLHSHPMAETGAEHGEAVVDK